MSEEDLHRLDLELCDGGEDAVQLTAWVDNGSFPGVCAPQQSTVLLEGRDRNDAIGQHGLCTSS